MFQAPKLETKKKIKKDKATLDVTQETIPSQMEEDHHGEDKIQEENIPTQPIDDMEINKETSHSQPGGMEIIMSK